MDVLSTTTLLDALGKLAHELKGQEATLALLLLCIAIVVLSLATLIYALRSRIEK